MDYAELSPNSSRFGLALSIASFSASTTRPKPTASTKTTLSSLLATRTRTTTTPSTDDSNVKDFEFDSSVNQCKKQAIAFVEDCYAWRVTFPSNTPFRIVGTKEKGRISLRVKFTRFGPEVGTEVMGSIRAYDDSEDSELDPSGQSMNSHHSARIVCCHKDDIYPVRIGMIGSDWCSDSAVDIGNPSLFPMFVKLPPSGFPASTLMIDLMNTGSKQIIIMNDAILFAYRIKLSPRPMKIISSFLPLPLLPGMQSFTASASEAETEPRQQRQQRHRYKPSTEMTDTDKAAAIRFADSFIRDRPRKRAFTEDDL